MHLKTLAIIFTLGLPSAATAAGVVVKLPGAIGSGIPMILPAASIMPLSMPGLTPVTMPTIQPLRLPGVPSPLPMPLPVALNATRLAAPSLGEHFVLNWSLLDDNDDGEAAADLVPNKPGPKPLAPAGALNELRDAALNRKSIRMPVIDVFDGRNESTREIALPHAKFF